jgi:hypothetical protein
MSQPSILSFFKKPGTAVATAKPAPSRKRPRAANTAPSSSQEDVARPVVEQHEHVVIDSGEQTSEQQAVQSPKHDYADSETSELPLRYDHSDRSEQSHSKDSSDDDADATLTGNDAAGQHSDNLSAFELQRLANIKRNNAFLSSLGLQAAKPAPLVPAAASRKRKASSTAKRTAAGGSSSISSLPARRSSRLTGDKAVCYNEDNLRVLDDTTASKQVCPPSSK